MKMPKECPDCEGKLKFVGGTEHFCENYYSAKLKCLKRSCGYETTVLEDILCFGEPLKPDNSNWKTCVQRKLEHDTSEDFMAFFCSLPEYYKTEARLAAIETGRLSQELDLFMRLDS